MVTLPKIPDWFTRELAKLGSTPDGRPMFRVVDGQKEMIFMAGQWRTKYQLTEPVRETVFTYRRINLQTGNWEEYESRKAANEDKRAEIHPDVQPVQNIEIREIGYPCYVLECWTSPEELGEQEWIKHRYSYEFNDLTKKYEWVDMLGEFPREGKYVYLFEVLDSKGSGIAPNQRTLDELKKRIRMVENDKRPVQQKIDDEMASRQVMRQKIIDKAADNFIAEGGIHLGNGVAIGKPISKVKG